VLKQIFQNPKFFGPLLVAILFIAANLGSTYVIISRSHVEKTLPDGAASLDLWTENRTFWASDGNITESSDHIDGIYYGNASMEFSATNTSSIYALLKDIGFVNCSGTEGYTKLSFRIKMLSPEMMPEKATVLMLSASPADYFSRDITETLANSSLNVWNNITLTLASQEWQNNSALVSWENIVGMRLELVWPSNVTVNVLVDGLFFHGFFRSLLEDVGTAYLTNYSFRSVMQFAFTLVFVSALIYLLTKNFGASVTWKPWLIVVGFILITLVVQAMINALTLSTLPNVYYPFEYIGGVAGEGESAYQTILSQIDIVSQVGMYVQVAIYAWTVALCTVAIHLITEFKWIKSFLIGTTSYLAGVFATALLLAIL